MAAISKLNDLVQKERARVVDMNECKILLYRKTFGIVTGDLGSCHVVVLQSPIAVLLSHISPRSSLSEAQQVSGDDHVGRKMDEALDLYEKWRSWFPQGSSAWGVYAWYNKSIALGDQKKIIEQKLAPTRLPISDRYYTVPMTNDKPGRGTVVCGWMDGDRICKLYVEDNLQNEIVVHDKHLQLASTLANTIKSPEASKASSSTVSTTRTASVQASGSQTTSTQSSGAAAVIAATAILERFGIDSSRARAILQKAFHEAQKNPALSGDNEKAAAVAACRAIMEEAPQKLSLDDAKELLRRVMSNQSSS